MSSKLSPHGGRGPAPNLSEEDRIEGPFETNVPERTRGLMARLFARREKQADVERRTAPSGGAPTPAGEAVGAAPPKRRRLSLALQGGGAFGAFTWGVLDRLLEADEIDFDAVSGASAGAINAVLLASGLARGGRDEARASTGSGARSVSARSGCRCSARRSSPPRRRSCRRISSIRST